MSYLNRLQFISPFQGPGTIGGRFENVGVENTEEHRPVCFHWEPLRTPLVDTILGKTYGKSWKLQKTTEN